MSTPSSKSDQDPPSSPSSSPPDSLISAPSSLAYWSSIPPSVSGMLGGFPQVSATDLRGSHAFLTKLPLPRRPGRPQSHQYHNNNTNTHARTTRTRTRTRSRQELRIGRAVDCGAGIGRITHGLLLDIAESVDVVEPVEKFAEVVRESQQKRNSNTNPRRQKPLYPADKEEDKTRNGDRNEGGDGRGKIGSVLVCGLEDWDPTAETATGDEKEQQDGRARTYDLIWAQWCLGHLTDAQLISFLQRCAGALTPPHQSTESESESAGGFILIKENLSTSPSGADIYDSLDSSVTRTEAKWEAVFARAGLRIERKERQTGFPRGLGLMPVMMWAVRPRDRDGDGE